MAFSQIDVMPCNLIQGQGDENFELGIFPITNLFPHWQKEQANDC